MYPKLSRSGPSHLPARRRVPEALEGARAPLSRSRYPGLLPLGTGFRLLRNASYIPSLHARRLRKDLFRPLDYPPCRLVSPSARRRCGTGTTFTLRPKGMSWQGRCNTLSSPDRTTTLHGRSDYNKHNHYILLAHSGGTLPDVQREGVMPSIYVLGTAPYSLCPLFISTTHDIISSASPWSLST